MIRTHCACIGGVALLSAVLSAQSTPRPTVRIRFTDGTERPAAAQFMFRKPDGTYLQPGAAGGNIFDSLLIPRPTDHPTDGLKARVWTQGCAIKAFDIPLPDADVEVQFVCDPEKTVTFRGRVAGFANSTVLALYRGTCVNWIRQRENGPCFFPIAEATSNLDADGSFTMDLPDFKADPIVSSDSSAVFRFFVKTPDGAFRLVKPERSTDPSITVASSYPEDVSFVLAK